VTSISAPRKIDRRKELAEFYAADAVPKIVDVPAQDCVMIDGLP